MVCLSVAARLHSKMQNPATELRNQKTPSATRMPFTFNYDPTLKIPFTLGGISPADVVEHLDNKSDEKPLAHHELIDASHVRVLVHRLHRMMQEYQFGLTALVTTNDEVFE